MLLIYAFGKRGALIMKRARAVPEPNSKIIPYLFRKVNVFVSHGVLFLDSFTAAQSFISAKRSNAVTRRTPLPKVRTLRL